MQESKRGEVEFSKHNQTYDRTSHKQMENVNTGKILHLRIRIFAYRCLHVTECLSEIKYNTPDFSQGADNI